MSKKVDNSPKGYDQRPTPPNEWLHDGAEDNRQFVKVIHLPIGEVWLECTNADKEQWEEEHRPPVVEPVLDELEI